MRVVKYISEWSSIAKEALSQTFIVAKFLCLLHVTNAYICSPTLVFFYPFPPFSSSSPSLFWFNQGAIMWLQVFGPSMLPTLNLSGDVLLAEHVSHRLGKVGPGDVVLVRSPLDPRKIVTKRIVGMEGDRISFSLDPSSTDSCHTIVV